MFFFIGISAAQAVVPVKLKDQIKKTHVSLCQPGKTVITHDYFHLVYKVSDNCQKSTFIIPRAQNDLL